jgi:hypothetical protein
VIARLMKYGKQPWSEIMDMDPDELEYAYRHLMELVQAENDAAKKD